MNVNLPKIAQVVVGLPVEGPFDYAIGEDLQGSIAVGCRVRISFNRRNRLGFVVALKQKSPFKNLKSILSIPDGTPILDDTALKFTKTFSAYYGCSWGEAIETCLPAALRKGRSAVTESLGDAGAAPGPNPPKVYGGKDPFLLIHDKSRNQSWPFLLNEMQATIKDKRSVIILIPEVSFLEEVLSKLKEPLASSWIVLDKTLTSQKELEQWLMVKKSKAVVVVGTRSAVFAPAGDVGLIVILAEEHRAYKQQQSPHYHARETALMRSGLEHSRVILVSSTPSAEAWEMAKKTGWRKMTLEADRLAALQTVDMTNYNPKRSSLLSFPLQSNIQKILENKGKIVLLMNRLGFTTRTCCPQCGFQLKCGRCDVNLIYLYAKKKMVCRLCSYQTVLPKMCPHCAGSYLRSTGMGIEKFESEVARLYPQASVTRYERESAFLPAKADIIIATQAILKELGRWTADLIALIQFDMELHRLDFRSAHKAFALLVHLRQLAGEKLLVQTHMPDNYVLQAARKMDFDYFYRQELKHRRELNFPPYRHLVAVALRAAQEDVVFAQSQTLYERLSQRGLKTIEVSDPHPDMIPKLRGKYRYTILLKGRSVKAILTFVKSVLKDFKRRRNTIITIDVDP